MNETYDVIILGTGFKECILSGLLSCAGKKVLHIDRNPYYGGECASLNLHQLWNKFPDADQKAPLKEEEIPKKFGRIRDYAIDLCPKFIMACGSLVKVLLHTQVTKYLDFKQIAGSYVFKAEKKDGKIHKVPATAGEGLKSSLLTLMQKPLFQKFLTWVSEYEVDDAKTHGGLDIPKLTMRQVFAHFKIDGSMAEFVGHAIALYLNDAYLDQPAMPSIERLKLYAYSLSRYGLSPYIYPLYGLSGIPEGFSRLASIHGGTYMLSKPVDKILYKDGKVEGIVAGGETAKCAQLIGDPSYFVGTDKVKKTMQVARWIFLLNHPVPNTGDADSCQIILPQSQLNRKNDIYVAAVSAAHNVCAKGYWTACVSTIVETNDPKKELAPAVALLGPAEKSFFFVSDCYAPTDDHKDNVFVTASYDASSHFEIDTQEVLSLYEKIAGKPVDLSISADPEDIEKSKEQPVVSEQNAVPVPPHSH